MEIETIQPYTNIPQALPQPNEAYRSQFQNDMREMQVGFGSKVLRADKQGLWLGAKDFSSAPFRVDMDGNVTATSMTLSGYVATGGSASDINGNPTEVDGGKLQANTVIASKLNVATLSAITADIGAITAGTIDGVTITGGTIQTSATGLRLVMSGSNDAYEFRSGSTLLAHLKSATVPFSGLSGAILEHGTGEIGIEVSGQGIGLGSRQIYMQIGGTDYFGIVDTDGGTNYLETNLRLKSNWLPYSTATYNLGSSTLEWQLLYLSDNAGDGMVGDFVPSVSSSYDLGNTSYEWQDLHLNNDFWYRSVSQPVLYHGYLSGTTISKDNNSFTATNPSTGNYTITHNLGTTNYNVVLTPYAVSGGGAPSAKISSLGSNSFDVITYNDAGTATAFDFYFLLTLNTA